MFKRYRFYIIAGIILIIGIVLVFNKILLAGLIIVGAGVLLFVSWEFFLKERAKQVERLNQKVLDTEEENKRLQELIDDYATRKLNISEVNTILELGLFEVTTNFRRTINQKQKINEKNVRFFGVVNVDFIAKYGVDIRKLRFKIDEANRVIYISNADPTFLSFTHRKSTWEIDEILEYNIPVLGAGHWRTNPKLDSLSNQIKEEVRLQVEKDSENGPSELKWIIEPLRKHVEKALELILGAQGYRIRITELDDNDYVSFNDFTNEKQLGS